MGRSHSPQVSKRPCRTVFALFISCSFLALANPTLGGVSADDAPSDVDSVATGEIDSSMRTVVEQVETVKGYLELIRLELGKPPSNPLVISVKDASPNEVYFQAITLFRKSNQMSFEQLRVSAPEPRRPIGSIEIADVSDVLGRVLERIRMVKDRLGIVEDPVLSNSGSPPTLGEVTASIIEANRVLNLLLDKQYSPSDVYQQVTLGISYLSRILAAFPDSVRIPDPPPFVRQKRPADVYMRIVQCMDRLRAIAQRSNYNILILEIAPNQENLILPSDVYDVATMLVSGLNLIHYGLKDTRPPVEPFHPGRKTPSHVFNRVGILEEQLIELERKVVPVSIPMTRESDTTLAENPTNP